MNRAHHLLQYFQEEDASVRQEKQADIHWDNALRQQLLNNGQEMRRRLIGQDTDPTKKDEAHPMTRAQVKVTIEKCLDHGLPNKYDQELFNQKCEVLYQYVYDSYYGQGRSLYEQVA